MKQLYVASVLFALAGFALAWLWWPQLPDPMPSHWGIGGVPDGFMPRWIAVCVGPFVSMIPAAIGAVMQFDPRQQHTEQTMEPVKLTMSVFAAFGFALQYLMLNAARSENMHMDEGFLLLIIGVLWIVMAHAIPKARSNFFFGIRTPWTLSNEAVWHRTHRLGGWTFLVGGVVTVVASLALADLPRLIVVGTALTLSALVPVVYSFFAWRTEQQQAA